MTHCNAYPLTVTFNVMEHLQDESVPVITHCMLQQVINKTKKKTCSLICLRCPLSIRLEGSSSVLWLVLVF